MTSGSMQQPLAQNIGGGDLVIHSTIAALGYRRLR